MACTADGSVNIAYYCEPYYLAYGAGDTKFRGVNNVVPPTPDGNMWHFEYLEANAGPHGSGSASAVEYWRTLVARVYSNGDRVCDLGWNSNTHRSPSAYVHSHEPCGSQSVLVATANNLARLDLSVKYEPTCSTPDPFSGRVDCRPGPEDALYVRIQCLSADCTHRTRPPPQPPRPPSGPIVQLPSR